MNVFEQGLNQIGDFKATVAHIQTENDQEIAVLQNTNALCDILTESLTVLRDNYELIQKQPRPDISYQAHAANVIGCKSILKDQAAFIEAAFNNYPFQPPVRVTELIPYFERATRLLKRLVRTQLNQEAPGAGRFARLLRKLTFLDAILGRRQNVHDTRIEPAQPRKAFRSLLVNDIQPQSGDSSAYARAVYAGDCIQKRLGKWVPSIESALQKQDVKLDTLQQQEISFHIVFGRLFVSFVSNEALFSKNTVEGLRLARLVLATQQEGELVQPQRRSRQEYVAAFQALNEYLRNFIKLSNDKNDPNQRQINFVLHQDEKKQLKQVFDTIIAFTQLLENATLGDILDDLFEKTKANYDDNVRIRQALKLLNLKYQQQQDYAQAG